MSDLHPIREYREAQKPPQSQAEFGKLFGVDKTLVSRWENRRRLPEPEQAAKIEEATGIDARVLLGIPKRQPRTREVA